MKSLIEAASLLRGVVPELKMYEERVDIITGAQTVFDFRYLIDSSRGTFSPSLLRRDYSFRRSGSD